MLDGLASTHPSFLALKIILKGFYQFYKIYTCKNAWFYSIFLIYRLRIIFKDLYIFPIIFFNQIEYEIKISPTEKNRLREDDFLLD